MGYDGMLGKSMSRAAARTGDLRKEEINKYIKRKGRGCYKKKQPEQAKRQRR